MRLRKTPTGKHISAKSALGRAATATRKVSAAVAQVHAHCAVYTQPEVAESILDRLGWTSEADLSGRRLLEPSCGDGAFLLPAVDRLLSSRQRFGGVDEASVADSIVAFEFDESTSTALRAQVAGRLSRAGLSRAAARRVSLHWIRCDDFLLASDLAPFTDVVGNPPYMRWSKVPAPLRAKYELALPSHAARGDLCLAFVCRSVELMSPRSSRVAFLCSDRWLRCSYGSKARGVLEETARLTLHIGVQNVPVFAGTRKVDAHAAVSILERDAGAAAVVGNASSIADLRRRLLRTAPQPTRSGAGLHGRNGAVLARHDLADAFQDIASTCSQLSTVGVEVRCGLALGSTAAFVIEGPTSVERSRLIPFAKTKDLQGGSELRSSSKVVNVWESNGDLIDLSRYPNLMAHLEPFRADLAKRACVKKPEQWYRTIDRLDLGRIAAPKLLVAGMSKFARVATSRGGIQHSNALYAITSSEWPLDALFTVFQAGVLDLFAAVLAPRFRGNVKRFDGNLLRQVRLPRWSSLHTDLQEQLVGAGSPDAETSLGIVLSLYSLGSKRLRRAVESTIRTARASADARPMATSRTF